MKPRKLLCLVFALTFITAGFESEANKVNKLNKSPLQAAADGTIEQVKLLLSKRTDVNSKNKFGWMALHFATTQGSEDVVELPITSGGDVNAENKGVGDFQTRFLTFCDLAVAEFNKEITRFADRDNADPTTHHMPFFEDAHAVRALAVAYDMTGEQKYLDACRRWSDHIIEYQCRMIPPGAYYMNHSRAPGEDHGQWNVADSGSIAMGVLATAIRCDDPTEKAKYLESVKAFARLVMENYVGPEGGISNGLWPAYDGQWWCSTATFGTMAFVLYQETGEKKYLKVAKGALNWMTHQDFREVKPITFQQRPSGIIFYCFELYATGLRYLKPDSRQYNRAIRQIDLALDWMAKNQKTRGANVPHYVVRNVDMAGLPYLMYGFARQLPQHRGLIGPADGELRYIGDLLLRNGTPNVSPLMVWEVMTWGMMSYAEKLSPGALHRSSK